MPNIFRKNPRDYRFLAEQQGDRTDRQFRDAMKRSGDKINWDHDFSRRNFTTDAERDTAAFGLVLNNVEAMQAEIEEVLRERFMIPDFVPINSAIPEGAQSYALRVINRYGKGKFINKDGSNVESATASVSKMVFNVEYAGIQPEWTIQELREVLFTGIGLSNETLEAGTQGALDHIQEVGFNGDADLGFTGLLNSADVPVYAGADASTQIVQATTADAIVAAMNNWIIQLGQTSNEIVYQHFGNSDLVIALPTAAFDHIASRRMGDGSDRTIMNFFLENNVWKTRTGKNVIFKSLSRLSSISVSGSGTGRAIIYPWNRTGG